MESRAPRYVKATVRRKFLASHWNCCANGSSLQFSRLTRISIPQWRRSSLQHSISNGKRRRRPEGCSVYANPQCARRRLRQDQCQRSSGACIIGLSTSNVEMNAGATDLIRMPGCLSSFLQVVRRQCGKASVLDWATHSEMVEALPIARRDSEHLVNRIIEVAADPGRTNTRLFRLEVQHLAHETGLPEEISVEAGATGNKAVHVFGDHPKAEGPVPRDVLTAGDARGQSAAVPFFEQVQRKAMWARRRTQPHELTPHRLPEFLHLLRIASEHVETRRQVVHAVHEEAQVDAWAPG